MISHKKQISIIEYIERGDINMKVIRTCKTCEFNINNICESHHSQNGYKWNIQDLNIERKCWSVSSEYGKELINNLSEEDKQEYKNNHGLGVYDVIRKLETGRWK